MHHEERLSHIRNFCIIAHIDHGKIHAGGPPAGNARACLTKRRDDGADFGHHGTGTGARHHHQGEGRAHALSSQGRQRLYVLNLIDTPGHVDFTYEVSRALAACEGALLVVDATQGIEAQTLANAYMALEHDLEIVPVINKIDLPSAQPEEVKQEIEDVIGLDASDAPLHLRQDGREHAATCWKLSSGTSPRPRATRTRPCRR